MEVRYAKIHRDAVQGFREMVRYRELWDDQCVVEGVYSQDTSLPPVDLVVTTAALFCIVDHGPLSRRRQETLIIT